MNYSLTIFFLPIGLWRAKARQLLGGFWVNDGCVTALKVLFDADCMTIAFLSFLLAKYSSKSDVQFAFLTEMVKRRRNVLFRANFFPGAPSAYITVRHTRSCRKTANT